MQPWVTGILINRGGITVHGFSMWLERSRTRRKIRRWAVPPWFATQERDYLGFNSRTALAYSSVALINSAPRLFGSCASAFLRASRTSFTFFSAVLTSPIVDILISPFLPSRWTQHCGPNALDSSAPATPHISPRVPFVHSLSKRVMGASRPSR